MSRLKPRIIDELGNAWTIHDYNERWAATDYRERPRLFKGEIGQFTGFQLLNFQDGRN